jgi:hypothetical protein
MANPFTDVSPGFACTEAYIYFRALIPLLEGYEQKDIFHKHAAIQV